MLVVRTGQTDRAPAGLERKWKTAPGGFFVSRCKAGLPAADKSRPALLREGGMTASRSSVRERPQGCGAVHRIGGSYCGTAERHRHDVAVKRPPIWLFYYRPQLSTDRRLPPASTLRYLTDDVSMSCDCAVSCRCASVAELWLRSKSAYCRAHGRRRVQLTRPGFRAGQRALPHAAGLLVCWSVYMDFPYQAACGGHKNNSASPVCITRREHGRAREARPQFFGAYGENRGRVMQPRPPVHSAAIA